jgi:peptidoglycan/xylan/chitin deacetylase (PgdA/CDA1 family)
MRGWDARRARWGTLTMLLLLAAALPSTGGFVAVPLAAPQAVWAAPMRGSNPARAEERIPRPIAATTKTVVVLAPPTAPSLPVGPSTYVPILYYHYIRINPNPRDRVGFGLSVPPAMFRAQMQYLADHGYHVVGLHDAVMAILRHSGLPSRPVVLTFDDGYADFYTAAIPILQSYGFTATDFVISGRMGGWSYMTPAQVAAADSMGFTIGAHTVNHIALAAVAPARASWEMRQSKLTLEALLGHAVIDFAYPYGSFNAYDQAVARQLGFEEAAATIGGSWHWPGQLMNLYRIRVGGGLNLLGYAYLVGGPAPSAWENAIANGAVPTPVPTAAPTPTPSVIVSPSPTPSATPTPTPSPTPAPTPTPSAKATPTPSPSPSPSASAAAATSASASPTAH